MIIIEILVALVVLCMVFFLEYKVAKISLSTSISTVGFLSIIILAILIALQPGGCLK